MPIRLEMPAAQRPLYELSCVLWRERRLLDLLHVELLHVGRSGGERSGAERSGGERSGAERPGSDSGGEVELVVDRIRAADLLRAVRADEVAAMIGIDPGPSLRQLVGAAPGPWSSILAQHGEALRGGVAANATVLAEIGRLQAAASAAQPGVRSGTPLSLADFLT